MSSTTEGLSDGKLSDEQRQALKERLERTTSKVPEGYFAGRSDDEILEEELKRSYEALD